jgi:hypothetical protein
MKSSSTPVRVQSRGERCGVSISASQFISWRPAASTALRIGYITSFPGTIHPARTKVAPESTGAIRVTPRHIVTPE